MWEFFAGFAMCWIMGGAATAKFTSDLFAEAGRVPPSSGVWITLALWPRMLWTVGRD